MNRMSLAGFFQSPCCDLSLSTPFKDEWPASYQPSLQNSKQLIHITGAFFKKWAYMLESWWHYPLDICMQISAMNNTCIIHNMCKEPIITACTLMVFWFIWVQDMLLSASGLSLRGGEELTDASHWVNPYCCAPPEETNICLIWIKETVSYSLPHSL